MSMECQNFPAFNDYKTIVWKLTNVTMRSLSSMKMPLISEVIELRNTAMKENFHLQFIPKINDEDDACGILLELSQNGRERYHIGSYLEQDGIDVRFNIQSSDSKQLIELHHSKATLDFICLLRDKSYRYLNLDGASISWEDVFNEEHGLIGEDNSLTFVIQINYLCRTQNPFSYYSASHELLFNSRERANYIIKCGNVEIPVHKNPIEINAKDLLKVIVEKAKEANSMIVELEGVDPEVLLKFLEYCYIPFEFKHWKEKFSFELLEMAEKFNANLLFDNCLRMMSCLLTTDNVLRTMEIAHRHNHQILLCNCIAFCKMYYYELKDAIEESRFRNMIVDSMEQLPSTIVVLEEASIH